MPRWFGLEKEEKLHVESESIVAVVQETGRIVSDEVAEYSAPTPEPPTTPGRPDCGGCEHHARGWCILFPEKWVNASFLLECPRETGRIIVGPLDSVSPTPPKVQVRGRYEIAELRGGLYEARSRNGKGRSVMNRQKTDSIAWSSWSWNPITGCRHGCAYCYARDFARDFPTGFEPTLYPDRLSAPKNTPVPRNPEDRRCFVGSMADLFGEWVPQGWIDSVMDACREAPSWVYVYLSKNPGRLPSISFPENAWVGSTVDTQARVEPSISSLLQVTAAKRFLSCEPLLEEITFPAGALDSIDLIILGAQSRTDRLPEFQPELQWVEHVWAQAKAADVEVFWKPNLRVRPRETGEAA